MTARLAPRPARLGAALGALVLVVGVVGACDGDDGVERADTTGTPDVAVFSKSTWFETGFFIDWVGVPMVAELVEEIDGGGMHAVGPWELFRESTDHDDFLERLANDAGLHAKLELAATAGSPVIVQLEMMPSWLTSAPGDESVPCDDQPLWATWTTRAPAAERWSEWESLIEATVRYLTVERGYDHLWFQVWEEPDAPCFWTDTEAAYLELYERTAEAVKRANPDARVGGPGSTNPDGVIEPSTTPLVEAVIEHAATTGAPLDFVSYHHFATPPHRALLIAEQVGGWLDDNGFPDVPILISSYNPIDSASSPYWETPPTPVPSGRTIDYDTEAGAAYVPALSYALTLSGRVGWHTLFQLDDFDGGREFESDSAFGARTPEERNGIRKAMYQAMRLQAMVPDVLVATTVDDPMAGDDGALGPLGAIAGVDDDSVFLLLWSYVAGPGQEAAAIVVGDGHPDGLMTWDLGALTGYFTDEAAVSSVSDDPDEQTTSRRPNGCSSANAPWPPSTDPCASVATTSANPKRCTSWTRRTTTRTRHGAPAASKRRSPQERS